MITATVNLWEIFIGGWYTCVFYSYALGRDFVATQVAWNVYLSNTGFRNFNLILLRLHFRFMICLVYFTLDSSLQFSIPSYITHKTELLVQGLTLVGLFFFLVVFNQCFTILFAFKTVVGKYCVTLELKQLLTTYSKCQLLTFISSSLLSIGSLGYLLGEFVLSLRCCIFADHLSRFPNRYVQLNVRRNYTLNTTFGRRPGRRRCESCWC